MLEETLNEDYMLNEMAEMGRIGKYIIFMRSNDGGEIPHFHIGDSNTFPRCTNFSSAIKIEKAEYFPHGGKYTDKLNSKEVKMLVEWLNISFEGINNWNDVRRMWNRGNSRHKMPVEYQMPDYTKLA